MERQATYSHKTLYLKLSMQYIKVQRHKISQSSLSLAALNLKYIFPYFQGCVCVLLSYIAIYITYIIYLYFPDRIATGDYETQRCVDGSKSALGGKKSDT